MRSKIWSRSRSHDGGTPLSINSKGRFTIDSADHNEISILIHRFTWRVERSLSRG